MYTLIIFLLSGQIIEQSIFSSEYTCNIALTQVKQNSDVDNAICIPMSKDNE